MMSLAVALLAVAQAERGFTFAALPPRDLGEVAYVATIRVPVPLHERERAAWEVLGEALLEGTQDYSRETLLAYGAQGSRRPRVVVGDGFMRVEVVAPREGGAAVAAPMVASIVTRPSFRAEELIEARRRASRDPSTAWGVGARPWQLNINLVRDAEVRELYRWAFRPEWTTLSIGGQYTSADSARLRGEFAAWVPTPGPRMRPGRDAQLRTTTGSSVGVIDLLGPVVSPSSGQLPILMLAATALGVGKGGTLHRQVRDTDGVSYRQEAMVLPDATGWRLHVRLASRNLPEAAALRERLVAAVAEWTEDDRARAVALARTSLTRGLPVGPVWLSQEGPYQPDAVGDAAWAGIFAAQDVTPGRPSVIAGGFDSIGLDAIKALATDHLRTSLPLRIPASGAAR